MVGEINQDDWNGVYYDASVGEFYMVDVREDGVMLINPFVGDEVEKLGKIEFQDLNEEGSLCRVSDYVVQDPAGMVENLLHEVSNSINSRDVIFQEYDPIDVDFAVTATNFSVDDDAPYQSVE